MIIAKHKPNYKMHLCDEAATNLQVTNQSVCAHIQLTEKQASHANTAACFPFMSSPTPHFLLCAVSGPVLGGKHWDQTSGHMRNESSALFAPALGHRRCKPGENQTPGICHPTSPLQSTRPSVPVWENLKGISSITLQHRQKHRFSWCKVITPLLINKLPQRRKIHKDPRFRNENTTALRETAQSTGI